jgi:23S rRNA pseudouridine2457 synthase
VPAVFLGRQDFEWPPEGVLVLVAPALLVAFHKPYGFLSQFTPETGSRWRTLAAFGFPSRLYPIGRLDADSEGLLLLSDEAALNARLLHPSRGHTRTYWAQVERIPSPAALATLESGVLLGTRRTLPCKAVLLAPQPEVPPRDPPVRFRKTVEDCWISLELVEGKYHQVRRMTAAVGHPTLRLMRVAIGAFRLEPLAAGEWTPLDTAQRRMILER